MNSQAAAPTVITRHGSSGPAGSGGGPGGLSLTETIVAAEQPYRMEFIAKGPRSGHTNSASSTNSPRTALTCRRR